MLKLSIKGSDIRADLLLLQLSLLLLLLLINMMIVKVHGDRIDEQRTVGAEAKEGNRRAKRREGERGGGGKPVRYGNL